MTILILHKMVLIDKEDFQCQRGADKDQIFQTWQFEVIVSLKDRAKYTPKKKIKKKGKDRTEREDEQNHSYY